MARVGVFPCLAGSAVDGGCPSYAQAPDLIRRCIGDDDVAICQGVLHQGRAFVG